MQRSFLKLFITPIFLIFSVTACTNEREQEAENHFLHKVAEALSESGKSVQVRLITDFYWDQVCFFQNDDSEEYATYDEYKRYLDSSGVGPIEFKKAPYTNIFVFLHEGRQIQLYGFMTPKVRYKEKDIFLSVKGLYPNEDQTMQCLKDEETYLQPSADGQYVYIIRKDNK